MSQPSELPPGARIDGRYRIVAPLGAGGMGVVYRARDERLGRHVALKTLPAHRVGDERARGRLLREARAAAALEHPGIAQVYDVGETEDGGAYLVMELVRGQTLRELMRSNAVDRDELVGILEQLARALDHAHAQGVVHRDVKPDNVMVREDGRAVLLDFGLAKDLSVAVADTVDTDVPDGRPPTVETREGTLVGTLAYLAPEQARGDEVGPRSDQFSLATTAYEALLGRLPWDGESLTSMLTKILFQDPPPPSRVDAGLPVALDGVFARALAKDASRRFESCCAFVAAFRAALEQGVSPPPASERPSPRPTASSVRIPRIAATLLVVVAAAMVISLFYDRADDPVAPMPTALPEDAVIGCPVLEASGVTEPAGWLGAMAADLACMRATWHFGGDPARTRVPAELLELPAVAGEGFPDDPWAEPDARERTVARARTLDAWIDGSVAIDEREMRVTLALHRADGAVLARGEGRGEALYLAVGQAVDALVATPGVPRRERIDPALAPFFGVERPSTAILFDDLGHAALTGVGVEERCRALLERRDELTYLAGEIGRICSRWNVEDARTLSPPALDASTPATLALTAPEHAATGEPDRMRELAMQLAIARRRERHPVARGMLARAEIQLWEQLDELERARDLLLTAAEDLPRDWFLRVHLVRSMIRTPGAAAAARALAAWRPGSPEAWRTLALPVMSEPERALPLLRRAYESGGTLPVHGLYLADILLRSGRREEVRAIGARYATSGPMGRLASEYLRARVDITEARFAQAHSRLGAALGELSVLGRLVNGDVVALEWYLELSRVLGRERESADPLVQRLVMAEPHRLAVDQPHYELAAIELCMSASPELGGPCLARLRAILAARAARAGRIDGAEALLSGAERYVAGDAAGAVEAWRPLVRRRSLKVPTDVFVQVGEPALAERLEEAHLDRDTFAGAHLAHVRSARRALAAGDTARAREMAQRVVDAWSVADVAVPAVEEMRALLAGLPPPAQ
jgi:hypothetical protein